jgi:hypothetical protein
MPNRIVKVQDRLRCLLYNAATAAEECDASKAQ